MSFSTIYKRKMSKWISILILFVLMLSVFYILENKLYKEVLVEAGSEIEISQFIKDNKYDGKFVTDPTTIDLNNPGEYEIKIRIGRRTYRSKLQIEDTTEPKAQVVSKKIWLGEGLEAEEFVSNVVDATKVNIYFMKQPDFRRVGEQNVHIILEDTSGNKNELVASLIVKEDKEPPQISGLKDQRVYIGDPVSYKKDVLVSDNRDRDIALTIDNSNVNLKKEGTYKVIYSATDSSGNTTTKSTTLYVKKKPRNYIEPDEIHQLADRVLKKIIHEGMTDIEKAWEIFKWTNKHITYVGTSDKTDWLQGAAQGLKKGTGDCFNYYSTARELLTRAGFENICVERDSNDIHFWNLVKIKNEWYHFDTTPYRRGYPYVCFLRTNKEVDGYSKVRRNYYRFDKSKYPKVSSKTIKFHRN